MWVTKPKHADSWVARPETGPTLHELIVTQAYPGNKEAPPRVTTYTFQIKDADYGGTKHYHSVDATDDEDAYFATVDLAKEAAVAKYAQLFL